MSKFIGYVREKHDYYMDKAVFLDRDGTINEERSYLYRIEDFAYMDGAVEALHILEELGYLLIIITNQSGIARGYYTEEEFLRLNQWMIKDLKQKGIHIAEVYFCPHHPDGIVKKYAVMCGCRKPGTEFFWKAQKIFQIDMARSYAIGDRMRDISICRESGVQGIILGESGKDIPNSGNEDARGTIWRCASLFEATERITEESKR